MVFRCSWCRGHTICYTACMKDVCRKNEGILPDAPLSSPGSYQLVEHDRRSLILVRDEGGRLRCFLNQCRHRGARLATQTEGRVRAFVCPYHGWSYGTDGRLRGVPRAEAFVDLDRDHFGLVELNPRDIDIALFARPPEENE